MKQTTTCLTLASSLFLLLNIITMNANATETSQVRLVEKTAQKEQIKIMRNKTVLTNSKIKNLVVRPQYIVCTVLPELCAKW